MLAGFEWFVSSGAFEFLFEVFKTVKGTYEFGERYGGIVLSG